MTPRMIAAFACLLLLLPACGDASEAPHVEGACVPDANGAPLTKDEVGADGQFGVGELDIDIIDPTRGTMAHGGQPARSSRTLDTHIWYPATESGIEVALAPGGPYPLIVYSHGFSSFNNEADLLARYLATRGYITIAPRFPLTGFGTDGGPTIEDLPNQPGDVSFLIDTALAWHTQQGNRFQGGFDATRIAAVGLSLGGITSLLVTFHPTLHDPRIAVTAAMAPPTDILGEAFYDTRFVPLMLLSGDIDAIVPYQENARAGFDRANSPVALYTLTAGTHTGWTSVAAIFDGVNNADEIGCGAVGGEIEAPFDLVTALGGAANGLVPPNPVPECQLPLPKGMNPNRQLLIARLAIGSFLDSYFNTDAVARGRSCDFHEHVLRREPDITIERR